MKLLMISTDQKIFEEGSMVRERMKEYARYLSELHIIVFGDRKFDSQTISQNCFAYSTRSKSKWFYPFDAIRIGRSIISDKNINNITCQDPFLTSMAGVSLKKRFLLPLEIQVHTDIGSPYFTYTFSNRIRKSMAFMYLPKANHVRVVSQRIRKFLIENPRLKIADSKIEVRPIFVDTEQIKNASVTVDLHKKYSDFNRIVLIASRLEPEKNIKLSIEAWKKVVQEIPSAGLVIVGSGSEELKLKKLVDSLGINRSIVFESWQNDLSSYYKTADLLLLTSFYEGYGMTLVEAHTVGCRIVSTDVGIAKEIGANIVPLNSKKIAKKIVEMLV
ncbi:MAG: glycosyltransferase [Parcubacteria group bacterium]|nr:glycosyltransferase [Parcubacteria group bacterium]